MVSPGQRPRAAETDGRALRSERSRKAMVDALFALVGEGVLRPTAHQVAERAGVGIRTVFRHFSDMDTLFAEMNARLRAEVEPLLEGGCSDASPVERARRLATRRAAIFERIAPYKRSANLQRVRSPYLQEGHRGLVRELRDELRRCLPELAQASPELLDALELCTSFEAWDRLRSEQRLGPRRARAAMERAAAALASELGD